MYTASSNLAISLLSYSFMIKGNNEFVYIASYHKKVAPLEMLKCNVASFINTIHFCTQYLISYHVDLAHSHCLSDKLCVCVRACVLSCASVGWYRYVVQTKNWKK